MGKDRFIFTTNLIMLLDINEYRFRSNRPFKFYTDLFKSDLKKQKKSNLSYSIVCKPLMNKITNAFLDIVLEDICKNGETFKVPTKYASVFLGIDKKETLVYNINTGFDKYYLGIKFEDFFWEPYPFTVEYKIVLRKKFQDIIDKNKLISTDYYEYK